MRYTCAYEMHTHEVQAHETHAYEVHGHEVYPHEMHAHEMHAHEVHALEIHALEMHGRKVLGKNLQISHLTNGGAVVDLSRSEWKIVLRDSVGAGVRIAHRTHRTQKAASLSHSKF